MRIIAGKAGRIAIKVPSAVARPTTDLVRQAIFSILGERVVDAKVLDLFCGSGALGLEALSRGATNCSFIDESRYAITAVEQNLKKARLEGGKVVKAEVLSFVQRERGTYDLIFADPPYVKSAFDTDNLQKLLADNKLIDLLAKDGLLILEFPDRQKNDPPTHPDLEILSLRVYGSTTIAIYSRIEK